MQQLGKKKVLAVLTVLLSLGGIAGSAVAANLTLNGGFESGNNGDFSSAYTYVAAPGPNALYPEGDYAVGGNPRDYHDQWASFGPHEGSFMMIVNGATAAGVQVWTQTVPVVSNTLYYFSAYVASSYPDNPAVLDFSINSALLGSSLTASATPGQWDLFYATWNSGSNTSAALALVNQNTAAGGNDFCLDNIKMDTVSPAPLPSSLLLLASSLGSLGLLRFWEKS